MAITSAWSAGSFAVDKEVFVVRELTSDTDRMMVKADTEGSLGKMRTFFITEVLERLLVDEEIELFSSKLHQSLSPLLKPLQSRAGATQSRSLLRIAGRCRAVSGPVAGRRQSARPLAGPELLKPPGTEMAGKPVTETAQHTGHPVQIGCHFLTFDLCNPFNIHWKRQYLSAG